MWTVRRHLYARCALPRRIRPDTYCGARASLALGNLVLDRFRSVALEGELETAFAQKEALLAEGLRYLARAASLPFSETVTEALFRAGTAFEHFKGAILSSERPPDLSQEAREEDKLFKFKSAVRTIGATSKMANLLGSSSAKKEDAAGPYDPFASSGRSQTDSEKGAAQAAATWASGGGGPFQRGMASPRSPRASSSSSGAAPAAAAYTSSTTPSNKPLVNPSAFKPSAAAFTFEDI